MFSHVMVGSSDLERSKKFYDAALGTLGVGPAMMDGHRMFYMSPTGVFAVSQPINGEPCSYANGGTIGFRCESPEQAKAFHDAAVAAGGTSIEEPPGERSSNLGKMYLAYVRDPDGNKLCAMHR